MQRVEFLVVAFLATAVEHELGEELSLLEQKVESVFAGDDLVVFVLEGRALLFLQEFGECPLLVLFCLQRSPFLLGFLLRRLVETDLRVGQIP